MFARCNRWYRQNLCRLYIYGSCLWKLRYLNLIHFRVGFQEKRSPLRVSCPLVEGELVSHLLLFGGQIGCVEFMDGGDDRNLIHNFQVESP